MLFPNRAPAPQMRPGMGCDCYGNPLLGYAPGANAMGYAPGARGMGYVAHMGYAPGARGLGDFSPSMENAAVDANISPSDIDLLNSLGATDQDLSDLINGNTTLSAVYAKYGVTIPDSSTATANSSGSQASSTSSAPALESPKGSTLLFTCNWTAGVGNLSVSPNAAIAALTSQLQSHNMSVVSSEVTSSGPVHYGIQVLIQDNVGHDTIANENSIPTSIMQSVVENNFSGAPTLTMVTPGGSAGTPSGVPNPNPATSLATWLENNAIYIAAAVTGLVLLNNFTGKRR